MPDELLGVIASPPAWMRDALCPEYPQVEFFVDRGETAAPARSVCSRCLVMRECREYAVERGILEGIWGGTSPQERKALRRQAA